VNKSPRSQNSDDGRKKRARNLMLLNIVKKIHRYMESKRKIILRPGIDIKSPNP